MFAVGNDPDFGGEDWRVETLFHHGISVGVGLDHLLGQQDIHLSHVKFTHSDGDTPYRILVQHTITATIFSSEKSVLAYQTTQSFQERLYYDAVKLFSVLT
jgi:hypothetical protein